MVKVNPLKKAILHFKEFAVLPHGRKLSGSGRIGFQVLDLKRDIGLFSSFGSWSKSNTL
jgi:hypothetical protein